MDEMTTRNHALVAWSGDSLEGMTTWPSFPSAHGVLSVLAYLPLRGRAVLRDSRKTVRGGARPASTIRCGGAIMRNCFASVRRKIAGCLTKDRNEKGPKIAQSTHENGYIKPGRTFVEIQNSF